MAAWFSYAQQPVHPSQPWDGSAMPSQAGKLAVVTGANSGIGFFTARALAAQGAHVILACRSETRGRAAEKEITEYLESATTSSGKQGKVEFMELELARLKSVRAFVAALTARGFKTLDLLVNNAGLACPAETTTPDGFETQFQVNHLSHFYLTTLLFPLLRASSEARIVNVTSNAHRIVGAMEFETLAKGTDRSFVRYGRSKLANLMFTFELEMRLREAKINNIKVVAAHPGLTYSDMGAKWVEGVFPPFMWGFFKWVLTVSPTQETEMGALPSLYAATVEDVASGDFYGPASMVSSRGYPVKEVPQSTSRCEQDRVALWELSEQLTGTKFALL